jgi:hypothetical protein
MWPLHIAHPNLDLDRNAKREMSPYGNRLLHYEMFSPSHLYVGESIALVGTEEALIAIVFPASYLPLTERCLCDVAFSWQLSHLQLITWAYWVSRSKSAAGTVGRPNIWVPSRNAWFEMIITDFLSCRSAASLSNDHFLAQAALCPLPPLALSRRTAMPSVIDLLSGPRPPLHKPQLLTSRTLNFHLTDYPDDLLRHKSLPRHSNLFSPSKLKNNNLWSSLVSQVRSISRTEMVFALR